MVSVLSRPGLLTGVLVLMIAALMLPGELLADRCLNAPFLSGGVSPARCAVLWFGQVDNTRNHVNLRVGYNNEDVVFFFHIFDRFLWYDTNPTVSDLTEWDAVTVFLDVSGNQRSVINQNAFALVAQLNWWESREAYQVAYQGGASGWGVTPLPFSTSTVWRGNVLNQGTESRGWTATIRVPFSSLGVAGPPETETEWGFGAVVHDRDDAEGSGIPDQDWPISLVDTSPQTWGKLRFGQPSYDPGNVTSTQTVMIRHGFQGAVVEDAHVGGHSNCGDPFGPSYFDAWGSANYAGYDQINIQNQGDVADWPCYSKFYVTFPLDVVPETSLIVSAILRMHVFGSARGEPPPGDSLIHVMTVDSGWDESSITWNNAPLARENIDSTWVSTPPTEVLWPGVPYEWDVTRAVSEANAEGSSLQLALYESDTQYHSGKYFSSSDTGEWNAEARPTLEIVFSSEEPSAPSPPENLRIGAE